MSEYTHEDIVELIIMEFAKTAELFGLTTLESRLFAYMYLQDRPLTLDDMSEAMGKSRTSMSTSVRSLLDLNLVTRAWVKGVRKDLYTSNTPLFKIFMDAYFERWTHATANQKETLKAIKETIRDNETKKAEPELADADEKLKDMIEFHEEIINSFEQLKRS